MTETRNKKRFGLSHNALQGLALVFMLIDHTWATIVSGNQWMTCVGRLAFPIFAFLITEGYAHTRDWKVYAKRLFWFGVISEIPFNLMIFSSPIFPFHQNVMFTLLLGLLAIHFWETALTELTAGKQIKRLLECLACILLGGALFLDYGMMGVTMVLMFWVTRNLPYRWVFQLVGMVLLNVFAMGGMEIPMALGSWQFDFPVQGFAVLALGLIWLYNGEKGYSAPWMRYVAYAFYPVHMLVLYLIVFLR